MSHNPSKALPIKCLQLSLLPKQHLQNCTKTNHVKYIETRPFLVVNIAIILTSKQSQSMQSTQEAQTAGYTQARSCNALATIHLEQLQIDDKPRDVLHKILSLSFVISEPSAHVVQHHDASRSTASRELHRSSDDYLTPSSNSKVQPSPTRAIGWGSCGIVYEELGTSHVIKRAIKGNAALSEDCRLLNDLLMHKTVEEAFDRLLKKQSVPPSFHVPRLYSYMSRNDRMCWSTHARMFADGDRTPEDLLLSERIPPVHDVARRALIDQYCPEELKAGARLQDSNKDCLVRLYLGKRRDLVPRIRPRQFFGLQNFPLCLDQMQDLGLETQQYAIVMAEALAMMHWEARIDAADVEFVLGGPPSLTHRPVPSLQILLQSRAISPTEVAMSQSEAGATHIWLLDFNQCQAITMDEHGVDQAVKRFFDNDPYYPRPSATGSKDMALWDVFASQYLGVSNHIVDPKSGHLPQLFIEKVKERARKKAEAAQRSGGLET